MENEIKKFKKEAEKLGYIVESIKKLSDKKLKQFIQDPKIESFLIIKNGK